MTIMKKIILSIALLLALVKTVSAQDEGVFNHYLLNPMVINPGYTGLSENIQFFGHYRSQWSGFPGAPQTFAFSANVPIQDKIGLGAYVLSESIGSMSRFRGQLSYGYRYTAKTYKLGFGFSTEYHLMRLNNSVTDPRNNPFYDANDEIVMANLDGVSFFDASFGIYGSYNDRLFGGISTPNLIRARLGGITSAADSSRKRTTFRQVLAYVGYKIKSDKLTLEPSILARRVFDAPFEVDFNLKAAFIDESILAGISFRPGTSGQVGILAGTKQVGFQIYYSYQASIAKFATYQGSSHEVSVGLDIGRSEKKTGSPTEKKKRLKGK
jgi:type IX secretion system PorP/SprF family membrane protein